MARFLALTSLGLSDVLVDELNQLNFKILRRDSSGIHFTTNWEGCYRAHLCLRTATRILLPVLDFPAYKQNDLYFNIRKHDFTRYIRPDQTLSVDAHTRSSVLGDQKLVAMKVKDAIVDQFRDKFNSRPNINSQDPDLEVIVRIVKNSVSVAINVTGDNLSVRGYKKKAVVAPLREHLAAALVSMSGWNGKIPLIDPMCGSGTLPIEAALKALNIAPGTYRKKFAFQKHLTFQSDVWSEVLDAVVNEEQPTTPLKIYGFDRNKKALSSAQENAQTAGVAESITFAYGDVATLTPPPGIEPGIVIVNPPYGDRLGTTEQLKDVYRDLAFSLKQHFKGWKLCLLSGNEELTQSLRLKAEKKIKVYNSNIDCRFIFYQIK